MNTHIVGQLRPSQLLWAHGPGALIDLPNLSVITMGLERWDIEKCIPVEEARLLNAVRKMLGSQVTHLRIPPFVKDENKYPFSHEDKIGAPVRPFPRWLRCVRCGLLAEYDSDLFSIRGNNSYRPEQTHFVHTNCEKGENADAVPARFLLACRNGHLDDFPWRWFVHGGPSNCKGTLRFFEEGASLQTENLWVKCSSCNQSKSLVHAFGPKGQGNLPACRGRHPHLNKYDHDCEESPRAVLLGATNSWFPITLSVLAIPLVRNQISQLISDGWDYFRDAESIDEVNLIVKTLAKTSHLPGIDKYPAEKIWTAIQEHRDGDDSNIIYEGDIKKPEWDVLTSSNPPTDWPHFLSSKSEVPSGYEYIFHSVLLLERLREVNALVGYTRVEAPDDLADEGERPPIAALCNSDPDWVPAVEVHGEGIFIRFSEDMLSQWEQLDGVKRRDAMLKRGYQRWRNARGLDPNVGYPGIRYAMLHTFSHLLIREVALECGYNAASIRERIYSSSDDVPMAGVLVYTAAADSDGTLGGLIELGKPENLGRLIGLALNRAKVCSSDPLCSKHDPSEDRSLHLASCHACAFVSETSCEKGNRYLDRALLVETFECKDAAFFKDIKKAGIMGNIWTLIAALATELHPDQIKKMARKFSELESWSDFDQVKIALGSISKSRHFEAFEKECMADQSISPQQVSTALVASFVTANLLDKRENIEMVWTGPLTGLVPSRHTEQVLLEVISAAQKELFIVSFVAYDIESIQKALAAANDRGVNIQILLEESKDHGGKVDFDSVKNFKKATPSANFYAWKNELEDGETLLGAVHAKCAVADGEIAFISSANLTRAAMENNMELGIMVRGGNLPNKLYKHLNALVSTKIIEKI